MDVDALAAAVLPWADVHMPEAAAKTRAQAARPASYRTFLVRLVRRWYESGERHIPLDVLEESDLEVKMRTPTGREFTVAGRRVEGERRVSFLLVKMWAATGMDVDKALDMMDPFDPVVVDPTKPVTLPPYRMLPKKAPVVAAPPQPATRPDPSIVLELLPPSFRSADE
jgi:hypothetical protein